MPRRNRNATGAKHKRKAFTEAPVTRSGDTRPFPGYIVERYPSPVVYRDKSDPQKSRGRDY